MELDWEKVLRESPEVLGQRLAERLGRLPWRVRKSLFPVWSDLPVEVRVLAPRRRRRGRPRVAVLTPQLVDHRDPAYSARGGGERYCLDLVKLLQPLCQEVVVYQPARQSFDLEHEGVRVVGLPHVEKGAGLFWTGFNEAFHERWADRYEGVIYLSMEICLPALRAGSVVVSHGVWWDHFELHPHQTELLRCIIEGAGILVSVDTNTINWVRATWPALAAKCLYVPNYADVDFYRPHRIRKKGRVRVCFPRRLVEGRGYSLMLDIAQVLLCRYRDMAFDFVGHGAPDDEQYLREWSRREERVTWQAAETAEEMRRAYRRADIVVIPTLYSEGTSLSCLEAMACGKAVVATWVGGLSDLVIHEHNGLLVAPERAAIQSAIERLYGDPELRRRLGRTARQVALCFSKARWESRWREIFERYVGPLEERGGQRQPVHDDEG